MPCHYITCYTMLYNISVSVCPRADSEGFGCFKRTLLWLSFIFMGNFGYILLKLECRFYPKYSHPLSLYHIFLFNKPILLYVNVCKIAGWQAHSVDAEQTPRSEAYDLGLHYLIRSVRQFEYGNLMKQNILRNHPGFAPGVYVYIY